MDKNNIISLVESSINSDAFYNVRKSSDSISFRKEPLRGTISFEFNELVQDVLCISVEVVDKEENDEFKRHYKSIFKMVLDILRTKLNIPFSIAGCSGSFLSELRDILTDKSLSKLEISQQVMFHDEDIEIKWIYITEELLDLMPSLEAFYRDYKTLIKTRETRQKNLKSKILYKPFQHFIKTCGEQISFSVRQISPIIFQLDSPTGVDADIFTVNANDGAMIMYKEFHDSMKLKWLVEDTLFPSAFNLASIHCRGNIKSEAYSLQHAALNGDLEFDDIDQLFQLLTRDEFNHSLDSLKRNSITINNHEIDFERYPIEKIIQVRSAEQIITIRTGSGFPLIASEVTFEKIALF